MVRTTANAARSPRALGVLALVALAMGCRPGTVEVVFRADEGATYTYRYEVDATVLRSVDGGPTEDRSTSSVLQVTQRILSVEEDGAVRAEVSISRDGGPLRRAVVRLDRAGSLAAVDLLDGMPAAELGGLELGDLALAAAAPPGDVGPGQTWEVDDESQGGPGVASLRGSGRVDRLIVTGGRESLVATTDLRVALRSVLGTGASSAEVDVDQSSVGTTAYDLTDGAVRWADVRTTGEATVIIRPPPGVAGDPAEALVTYEVEVRARRR